MQILGYLALISREAGGNMSISVDNLRTVAGRSYQTRMYKSLEEAVIYGKQSAFLCHSHKDKDSAGGLVVILAENGWEL
jgi:hypothetical protein